MSSVLSWSANSTHPALHTTRGCAVGPEINPDGTMLACVATRSTQNRHPYANNLVVQTFPNGELLEVLEDKRTVTSIFWLTNEQLLVTCLTEQGQLLLLYELPSGELLDELPLEVSRGLSFSFSSTPDHRRIAMLSSRLNEYKTPYEYLALLLDTHPLSLLSLETVPFSDLTLHPDGHQYAGTAQATKLYTRESCSIHVGPAPRNATIKTERTEAQHSLRWTGPDSLLLLSLSLEPPQHAVLQSFFVGTDKTAPPEFLANDGAPWVALSHDTQRTAFLRLRRDYRSRTAKASFELSIRDTIGGRQRGKFSHALETENTNWFPTDALWADWTPDDQHILAHINRPNSWFVLQRATGKLRTLPLPNYPVGALRPLRKHGDYVVGARTSYASIHDFR